MTTLQNMLATACRIQGTFGGYESDSPSQASSSRTSFTLPSLPFPQPLVADLTSVGVPLSVAERLSDAYLEMAHLLRIHFEQQYSHACSRSRFPDATRQLLLQTLTCSYLDKLNTWSQETITDASVRVHSASLVHPLDTKSVRKAFNQDYIPLLEAFFTENQFPSGADKGFLARKSSMTIKQINTWFQNRRSRMNNSKGIQNIAPRRTTVTKTPKRTGSTVEPIHYIPRQIPEASDESDYDSMTECEPDEKEFQSGYSRSSSFTLVGEEDVICQIAPAHAFPTPYPPVCKEDPFPCKTRNGHVPKPVWSRTSTSHVASHSELDIESFISAFAKLSIGLPGHVFDPSSKPGKPIPQTGRRGCDVTAPITTRPLPAPLPSLVRFSPRLTRTALTGTNETRRPATHRPPPTRSCSGSSSGAVHSSRQNTTATKKRSSKKASLPKRVPTSKPVYRDANPPSPPQEQSRTSSFGSEGSIPSSCLSGASSSASSETNSPYSMPSDFLYSVSAPIMASSTFSFDVSRSPSANPTLPSIGKDVARPAI